MKFERHLDLIMAVLSCLLWLIVYHYSNGPFRNMILIIGLTSVGPITIGLFIKWMLGEEKE